MVNQTKRNNEKHFKGSGCSPVGRERSVVRIQSSANFISTVNRIEKTEKEAGNGTIFKNSTLVNVPHT